MKKNCGPPMVGLCATATAVVKGITLGKIAGGATMVLRGLKFNFDITMASGVAAAKSGAVGMGSFA